MQQIRDAVWKSKDSDYIGEGLSQLEHFVLTASKVEELYPEDKELIVAAFLHDIGHQLFSLEKMGDFGNKSHEIIGAKFLEEMGFSERIVFIVENHVKAKRYLTSKEPHYYEDLSEASRRTLEFQGGRFTKEEMKEFESKPYFKDVIIVRRCDDRAKNPKEIKDIKTQTLYYLEMTCKVIGKAKQF